MFLPGESQGQGSLVGCRLWGCNVPDKTEATLQQQQCVKKYDSVLREVKEMKHLNDLTVYSWFEKKR